MATVSGSSHVTVVPETLPPPDCVTAPGKVTETLVSTTSLKEVLLGWGSPWPPDGAAAAYGVAPAAPSVPPVSCVGSDEKGWIVTL